jgi:hypothetical protein
MTASRSVLLIAVLGAGWFAYRYFFPDDEAQIRRVLERIADAVGAGAEEEGEVSRLARAASVRNQLDPQISVDAGPPFSRMSGRDAIIGTIARLHGSVRDLDVEFRDVQITVDAGSSSARVHLTAEARFRERSGTGGLEARELEVTMRKLEGDWVVSHVALVQTLEPLTPR